MSKCLRCGATSEWIQGRVRDDLTETAWQPIETAPKDGTKILACVQGGFETLIVWWEAYRDSHEWFYDNDSYTWPTHWMPLPDPLK